MYPRTVCTSGHALEYKVVTGGILGGALHLKTKQCHQCHVQLQKDSLRHTCKQCNFHLCDRCYYTIACRRGHPLAEKTCSGSSLGACIPMTKTCCSCGKLLGRGAVRHTCKRCKFHLCDTCWVSIRTGSKDAVDGIAAPIASAPPPPTALARLEGRTGPIQRRACRYGSQCYRRSEEHLQAFAHPGDRCYRMGLVIFAENQKVSFDNLWQLFQYHDPDESGHLTKKEFIAALEACEDIKSPVSPPIVAEQAWLDAGGPEHEHVSFRQFSEWTQNFLQLDFPLGLEDQSAVRPCRFRLLARNGQRRNSTTSRSSASFHDNSRHRSTSSASLPGDEAPDGTRSDVSQTRSGDTYECCPCENFQPAKLGSLMCTCGHKSSLHRSDNAVKSYASYIQDANNAKWCGLQGLVEITDKSLLAKLQTLLTHTHKASHNWTRDRGCLLHGVNARGCTPACASKHKKPVPSGYKLLTAFRNQNLDLWKRYTVQKAAITKEYELCDVQLDPVKVATSGKQLDEVMDTAYNEWYLFHGASSSNCRNICRSNFKLSCAGTGATWKDPGKHKGTPLYGFGIYFAENVTKADEYSEATLQEAFMRDILPPTKPAAPPAAAEGEAATHEVVAPEIGATTSASSVSDVKVTLDGGDLPKAEVTPPAAKAPPAEAKPAGRTAPAAGTDANCFAVLLCRVLCGRTNIITTNEIKTEKLRADVFDGPYHSVLGDRVASLNKPYREIVVYDEDQCYPEFLLLYSRSFK